MSVSSLFNRYRISYFAPNGAFNARVKIFLYNGRKYVGELWFRETDSPGPLPKNSIESSGSVRLFYRMDDLDHILGILRYEKPLYVKVSDNDRLTGLIATHKEIVGEEET